MVWMHSLIVFKSSSGKFLTINWFMQQSINYRIYLFFTRDKTFFYSFLFRSTIFANSNAIVPLNIIYFEGIVDYLEYVFTSCELWNLLTRWIMFSNIVLINEKYNSFQVCFMFNIGWFIDMKCKVFSQYEFSN